MNVVDRVLGRIGREVTIRNYETDSSDDYGENWVETAGSPHTVIARIDYRRSPVETRDEFGTETDIDLDAFVKDSAAGGIDNIRDGGGEGASELDVDGHTYVVLVLDNQDNGLLNLRCRREI